jgi:hypothetical protein
MPQQGAGGGSSEGAFGGAPGEEASRADASIDSPSGPVHGTPTGHHSFVLEQEKVEEIVVKVRKQKPTLGAALEKAMSWELDEESLTLVFGDTFSARGVQQDRLFVEEIVQEALDEEVALKVEVRNRDGSDGDNAPSDENVEMVKKVFRGEIVGEEQ